MVGSQEMPFVNEYLMIDKCTLKWINLVLFRFLFFVNLTEVFKIENIWQDEHILSH